MLYEVITVHGYLAENAGAEPLEYHHVLDVHGPALQVDTACSSASLAVHRNNFV